MTVAYQVRVKDTIGVLSAMLVDWLALSYTNRVNGIPSHVLTLNGGAPSVPSFVLDAQVEVWRQDPEAGIPWTLDYEGFHRTAVQATEANNRTTFTSYGRGYADLLARRAILYPAGSTGADKSGPGETVIKAYVDENAGPGATAPPRLYEGVTAGLTLAPDGGAGAAWEGSRAWRSLLDVLQEIAIATGVDFAVVGVGAGLFEFRAVASPLGKDRSTAGLDQTTGLNAAGNAPVVFALGFGNMASPRLSVLRTDEINAVIALGQGLADLRETVERTDPVAVASSPWNRHETTRQANTESTTAGLNAVGDTYLLELAARTNFSFEVLQTVGMRYGRDYFCSDLVTAQYLGASFNLQIVEVAVSYRDGRETVDIGVRSVPTTP